MEENCKILCSNMVRTGFEYYALQIDKKISLSEEFNEIESKSIIFLNESIPNIALNSIDNMHYFNSFTPTNIKNIVKNKINIKLTTKSNYYILAEYSFYKILSNITNIISFKNSDTIDELNQNVIRNVTYTLKIDSDKLKNIFKNICNTSFDSIVYNKKTISIKIDSYINNYNIIVIDDAIYSYYVKNLNCKTDLDSIEANIIEEFRYRNINIADNESDELFINDSIYVKIQKMNMIKYIMLFLNYLIEKKICIISTCDEMTNSNIIIDNEKTIKKIVKYIAESFSLNFKQNDFLISDDVNSIYSIKTGENVGTLGTSCMREGSEYSCVSGKWLYNTLGAKILYILSNENKLYTKKQNETLQSRALIWENVTLINSDKKINLIDRSYGNNYMENLYKKYAIENNYYYRVSNSAGEVAITSNGLSTYTKFFYEIDKDTIDKLINKKDVEFTYMPYFDTLQCIFLVVINDENGNAIEMKILFSTKHVYLNDIQNYYMKYLNLNVSGEHYNHNSTKALYSTLLSRINEFKRRYFNL